MINLHRVLLYTPAGKFWVFAPLYLRFSAFCLWHFNMWDLVYIDYWLQRIQIMNNKDMLSKWFAVWVLRPSPSSRLHYFSSSSSPTTWSLTTSDQELLRTMEQSRSHGGMMLRRERENILIMTLIPDIEMRLIEMFRDLAVYCGSITKFLLSTACALFFTMSTNFVVGAANGCRDILAEGIGRERINFGTIHFVALSRPFLFTWRSWQPI